MEALYILSGLLILMILSSIIVLCSNYKYYKKVYKQLHLMSFSRNRTQVYGVLPNKKPYQYEFIWFLDSGSFKLDSLVYIHNSFYSYLCPYTLYWLYKYKRWFKNNIDLNTIDKY